MNVLTWRLLLVGQLLETLDKVKITCVHRDRITVLTDVYTYLFNSNQAWAYYLYLISSHSNMIAENFFNNTLNTFSMPPRKQKRRPKLQSLCVIRIVAPFYSSSLDSSCCCRYSLARRSCHWRIKDSIPPGPACEASTTSRGSL